mmetsp:Transcript_40062/g.66461  ORF Transcript_40062/g.66461 Transcript_40062/m.66461 type:complete len:308 (-) Transcript_40062:420-1343(-)|eukprot:CAMPEP_0119310494 /NCGR_PEP_ID=MMETSP1333-20130426/19599_1 /TAXON_ID=418940 /ORGANISM="Scyphosphaera apsteinii, Strain RCC1455" /LENGTH=307 /DNA_ID=CAMNT_0007314687 /DNA_START=46 /DNA_END=969 /DNA_ORIENTATION=-
MAQLASGTNPPAGKNLEKLSATALPQQNQLGMVHAEPEKLVVRLEAPHGTRSEGELRLDKRQVLLNMWVLSREGKPVTGSVLMQVLLVYEDGEVLSPDMQASMLAGKTPGVNPLARVSSDEKSCLVKLRVLTVSRAHRGRRFRLRAEPKDPALRASRPELTNLTEPFLMINNTGVRKEREHKDAGSLPVPSTGGPMPAGLQPGAALATNQLLSQPGRRRNFPAACILAASDGGSGPDLSRSAVAICDRLATLVTQQIAKRAWQEARHRQVQQRRLEAKDVVSAVKKPENFDFLVHAGVLDHFQTEAK